MGSRFSKRERIFIEEIFKLYICTIVHKKDYKLLYNPWSFLHLSFLYIGSVVINEAVMSGGDNDYR